MEFKDYLKSVVSNKEARATELREAIKDSQDANEVRALGETLQAVLDELNQAKEQLAEAEKDPGQGENMDEGRFNPIATFNLEGRANVHGTENKEAEKRAQAFVASGKMVIDSAEQRATLVSSGKIATPTGVAGINDAWNTVSSIVDQVDVQDCNGMGSLKVAYEDTGSTASTQTEGAEITASDPTFGYVEIKPETIAVVSQISNQVKKQSPLQYEEKVKKAALNALRKEAGKRIVNGTTAGFKGITNSDLATKMYEVALDEKFLRNVAISYGGNENIPQGATLYLNKKSLIALGAVRGSDKKPVYEITPDTMNPNTGTIKEGGLAVKYTINSNIADNKTIYGQAMNYTLGLFGNYEIAVSEEYAFTKNMLTIRGTSDLGGAVTFKEGFIITDTAVEPTE